MLNSPIACASHSSSTPRTSAAFSGGPGGYPACAAPIHGMSSMIPIARIRHNLSFTVARPRGTGHLLGGACFSLPAGRKAGHAAPLRRSAIDYHGENMKLLPALCFTAALLAQTWAPQASNTRASLRGVSAVDARSVWASGSGGAWLATTDGGVTWRAAKVPGAETLDFRGI